MMPWREQLRLGWKIIRWVTWPSDMIRPVEIAAMYAVSMAALAVMTVTGSLLPLAGALIVAVGLGFFGKRP